MHTGKLSNVPVKHPGISKKLSDKTGGLYEGVWTFLP